MKIEDLATTGLLVQELSRRVDSKHGDNTIERIVLEHGVSFKGIDRPKGMRFGPIKDCFRNSFNAASRRDDMLYVEGFALVKDLLLIHHGWISPDGVHAIDPTLRYPPTSIAFFGIAFTVGMATKELMETDQTLPLFSLWKPKSRLLALVERAKSPTPSEPGMLGL